jgi:hypothetical protein
MHRKKQTRRDAYESTAHNAASARRLPSAPRRLPSAPRRLPSAPRRLPSAPRRLPSARAGRRRRSHDSSARAGRRRRSHDSSARAGRRRRSHNSSAARRRHFHRESSAVYHSPLRVGKRSAHSASNSLLLLARLFVFGLEQEPKFAELFLFGHSRRRRQHRLRTHSLRTHWLRSLHMKKAALGIHAVLPVPAVLAGAIPLRARHVHAPCKFRGDTARNLQLEISGREALRLENTGP